VRFFILYPRHEEDNAMSDTLCLLPWVGGAAKTVPGAKFTSQVSPIDEKEIAQIIDPDAATVDAVVKNAHAAYLANRESSIAQRVAWLNAAADAVEKAEGPIVQSLIRAIGKPRRAATFEAKRSAQFLRVTAQQLPHLGGEVLPLDTTPLGVGRFGFTTRIPYGVVAAITAFNAPANLLIQKAAPALAMGNAVVAKPSLPGTEVALIIADAMKKAGLPDGLFNVLPGGRDAALSLVAHPKVALVTLTGSTAAGHALVKAAGAKKFVAELGSNAANLVCADADLADAATKIAGAAFEASGQQCISAQRVIVERAVYEKFLELFVAAAKKLKVGDPEPNETDVGPMVSREAADRVEALVNDAVKKGAHLALAPTRKGCILGPAIVVDASPEARLFAEEAFGPVVVVQPVADVDAALEAANSSEFGLQGACFTSSLDTAFKVSRKFNVGSLWINEASRFRLDTYPFGGVGSSGFGREGVRYAMEELSQWKFTGIKLNQK
jgi:acyl-CoA reductase-like NAD-dependent aldehyde dehydrogenase